MAEVVAEALAALASRQSAPLARAPTSNIVEVTTAEAPSRLSIPICRRSPQPTTGTGALCPSDSVVTVPPMRCACLHLLLHP